MIPDDKKHGHTIKKLKEIRDRVLRLKVILVRLEDADDAYLIFETLNSRGMDLGVADLVKNHLTRHLKPKTKNVDVAKDRFLDILTRFDESEVRINMNNFIYHSWLSKWDYVGQKKLFKSIKLNVKNKASAKAYLDSLDEDSVIYRGILEPGYRHWAKEEEALRDSIEAINLFGAAQSRPLVLSLLRAYENKTANLKFVKKAMRQLENYHFIFTAITAQRAGGGFRVA